MWEIVYSINLCCLGYSCLSYVRKKIETWLASPASDTLTLNPQLFCQQIDKKISLWYNELLICFFIGEATKIDVLVSWRTTLVSLYWSNDLQLAAWDSKKMLLPLKCCFGFCAFGFEAIPPSKLSSHLHCGQNSPWASYCSFFCYIRRVLVTNLFSLLLIDIFWLFTKL